MLGAFPGRKMLGKLNFVCIGAENRKRAKKGNAQKKQHLSRNHNQRMFHLKIINKSQ